VFIKAQSPSNLEGSVGGYDETYTTAPSCYRCPCGESWPLGVLTHTGYLPAGSPKPKGPNVWSEQITQGPIRVKRWLACGMCINTATGIAIEVRDLFLERYPPGTAD